MRYAYAGFGEAGPVPAPVPTAERAPTVADKTPPYTRTALSIMGITALPWIPVFAGSWVGGKMSDSGKAWGALGGFAFSILVLRQIEKQMSGVIT